MAAYPSRYRARRNFARIDEQMTSDAQAGFAREKADDWLPIKSDDFVAIGRAAGAGCARVHDHGYRLQAPVGGGAVHLQPRCGID